MNKLSNVYTYASNVDPTKTTMLQNAFVREMDSRFKVIMDLIIRAVDTEDCFGLRKPTVNADIPGRGAFTFLTSSEKVQKFMEWLQEQIDKELLTVGELNQLGFGIQDAWTNKFILDSYKRGLLRARAELKAANVPTPGVDPNDSLGMDLFSPFSLDRLGLLYIRVYTELKGITDAMDQIISRILAQGIADGDGPAFLARKLVASINGEGLGDLGLTDTLGRYISPIRRASLIARTEIIRAHHMATINEYRNWGLEDVHVMGEWMTAGDARVCPKCMALQGKIFTLDEIEPLIPLHPLCRCVALPYIEPVIN